MSEEADAEEGGEESADDESQEEECQEPDSEYSESNEPDEDSDQEEGQEGDLEKEVEDENEGEDDENAETEEDDLEEKIRELRKKGINDERLFAKLREGDYSIFDEFDDLLTHFILSILNSGYVGTNNKEIIKKDYSGKKINVLILGTLEGEDNGAEYVKACKRAGTECYVISINYEKPLEEIAEEVAEKIRAIKEQTNADSVIAHGFSLGGAALFYATQMNGLEDVSEAVYINTPLSSERTLSTKIIQFIGGVKTKENAIAIQRAVNQGYPKVPSVFVYSEKDTIVPYESNKAIASSLGRIISIEDGKHTTIMDVPDVLVGNLYNKAA